MFKNLFKDKKILIMGLGLHGGGVENAKFFYRQGAKILITDLKPAEKLTESLEKLKKFKDIKYTLGKHEEKDFLWADLILKNPDVPLSSPYLEIAKKNKINIETDVSLFFKLSKAFMIGVTGTKGKSTTASLIYHILKFKYKKIFLVGNIGVSPLSVLPKIKKGDKVVLELSNFELEDLKQSPQVAVFTNILPDHLNRYATMQDYVNSKKPIFKYQSKKDYFVVNLDDSIVRQMTTEAKGKVIFFSDLEKTNIPAAIKVAEILKISNKIIQKAIKNFKGVHSRQELVREINGVKYINDTTATMPDALILAINRFPGSILICGGQNKGLEYKELTKEIKKKVKSVIMLPGTASDKIKENLLDFNNLYNVSSMSEAVMKAKELAKNGDTVLLSPGAASFNLFKNEFDRGNQFVKLVKELK